LAAKPDAPMNRSALVYIGSESYDAPTITVLQGLHHLGWTVYTLGKPNINSWFCNTVVESLDGLQVDFALSNLHWGTRWSLYGTPALDGLPRVLIDGDDSLPGESWRERHARYTRTYGSPPPGHEQLLVQPERWMEPLGDYRPDVLFVSQKQPGDATSAYLPFGIHDEYLNLAHDRPVSERSIDTLYVYGPGHDRTQMTRFLRAAELLRLLTRNTVLGEVRGDDALAEEIADAAARDNGVHGYYRWTHSRAYFEALGSSRTFVYAPPVATSWDSKRPWEALASGTLVLMLPPGIDMSEYSLVEECPEIVCQSRLALLRRLRELTRAPDELEALRASYRARALERFTPEPIARYFLERVASTVGA
jgi:hypothetical protein